MKIKCPACDQHLEIPDEMPDLVTCPTCSGVFEPREARRRQAVAEAAATPPEIRPPAAPIPKFANVVRKDCWPSVVCISLGILSLIVGGFGLLIAASGEGGSFIFAAGALGNGLMMIILGWALQCLDDIRYELRGPR